MNKLLTFSSHNAASLSHPGQDRATGCFHPGGSVRWEILNEIKQKQQKQCNACCLKPGVCSYLCFSSNEKWWTSCPLSRSTGKALPIGGGAALSLINYLISIHITPRWGQKCLLEWNLSDCRCQIDSQLMLCQLKCQFISWEGQMWTKHSIRNIKLPQWSYLFGRVCSV